MAYIGKSPSQGVRSRFQYQATAGQSSFSSTDANGLTLTYTDSLYMDVYQNGILLVPGDDYTATTGTTVVLVQSASLDDIIEMVVYDVFSVPDAVSQSAGGTFSGNVTMGGTLGVTGATTLSSTLGVAGASTLTGALSAKGGAVFNEDSADVDFRVETDGNANTLFIEGSSNNMSIGHSPPTIASGNGVHLADSYFIGFGVGNGTRPDYQLGQDSSTNNLVFRCGTGADTADLSLNTTGNIISTVTYNSTTSSGANMRVESNGVFVRSTSSRQYKNTITDATKGLTELQTLRPVTYKGNNDGDKVFGGLIAEEVHDAGLTEFVEYNEDGEPDALAYGHMVSLCIKAIQELSAKVTTLETEKTALEARITALENA